MTKLEEEMRKALIQKNDLNHYEGLIKDREAKAAAEVAKKYIEKAWNASAENQIRIVTGKSPVGNFVHRQKWLKENGII